MMRDFAELLSAYFDDSLAEGELAEFRAQLAASPDRLRQFVRDSVIHSRLRDVLVQHDMRGLVFDDAFADAIDPRHIASLLDEEQASAARHALEAAEIARRQALADAHKDQLFDPKLMRVEPKRMPPALLYGSFAAAAAVLIMIGRFLGPAPEAGQQSVSAGPQQPTKPPVVARVTNTFDARLRRDRESMEAGVDLTPGGVVLERGIAEIQFTSGAKVVVEGPAEIELMSASRARLVSGRAVAYVPERALGFTLQAEAAAFVDLGTEFGVEVAGGHASVYVLDGEVALVSKQDVAAPSRTLQRGVANSVANDGSIEDIPFDESRFVRRVPASAYELAVLKSRPLAYWRLGANEPLPVTSEGRLALTATLSAGVAPVENGATGRRAGGPPSAMQFEGEHDGIDIPGDALLGVVTDRTCEAWVLPSRGPIGPQRIFSTFERPRSGMAIGVVNGGWYKLPQDDLKFHFTTYGGYDCLSATPITPGQWVHLAATIDAAGTPTLYVNGLPVERRFRPMTVNPEGLEPPPAGEWETDRATPPGIATPGLARIGRNPIGSDGGISPERWKGQISNVAIYDRVLSADEIRAHYDATRNTMTDHIGQQSTIASSDSRDPQ